MKLFESIGCQIMSAYVLLNILNELGKIDIM